MIFRSPYPDVVVPDVGLPEFLLGDLHDLGGLDGLGEHADRVALVDGPTGSTTTYRELKTAVDRVAAALAVRGVGRGDVVAVFAPNAVTYPIVVLGALAAGAAVSPVNALHTVDELGSQLRDCGARLLVTNSSLLGTARRALRGDGLAVTEVVVLDPETAADTYAEGPAPVYEHTLADLLATTAARPDVAHPDVAVTGDDVALLPYSSGTSGRPKGVVLTHRNLVANLLQIDVLAGHLTPASNILAVLPFSHLFGLTVAHQGIRARAAVVTMPRFDFPAFLHTISRHRVDRVFIAPPIAVALAKHPLVDEYDLDSVDVVFSGAAALDRDLAAVVARRLGCTVHQGLGMTELSPVSHGIADDDTDVDLSSVGYPVPNVECKIVDPDTGAEATRGELWVRGPNVMRGYLHDPEATAATIDSDGFLHTGDVVTVTATSTSIGAATGVFHVVDRVKELIKYKGHQVAPAELEALLIAHPDIADVAVIGVTDNGDGGGGGDEVPKAFVVRRPGAALCDDDVTTFVASRVAPYKKVRRVEFIDRIPTSPSGKILRKELRDRELATT